MQVGRGLPAPRQRKAGVYLAQCESRPGMQWLLRRILAPPSPLIATFYMYRAQSDEEMGACVGAQVPHDADESESQKGA